MDVRKKELPNGLTIASEAMPHLRSVSIGIWVKTGSRFEDTADCGISHFDGETWTVNTPGDTVTTICYLFNIAFDPDSMLWAGGGIVLRCHDESWTSFSTQTGMEDPIAIYMEIGPDGKIWISGLYGLP